MSWSKMSSVGSTLPFPLSWHISIQPCSPLLWKTQYSSFRKRTKDHCHSSSEDISRNISGPPDIFQYRHSISSRQIISWRGLRWNCWCRWARWIWPGGRGSRGCKGALSDLLGSLSLNKYNPPRYGQAFQIEASFNSIFTLKDILLDLRYFGDRDTVWRE